MSEEYLIRECSPTLAGLKTGNLFSYPSEEKAEQTGSFRRLNALLVPRGIRLVPMKTGENRTLVYLYRPERLQKDLQQELSQKLLRERNYPVEDADRCVAELRRRLCRGESFPHEVGLFLGYPPGDVRGFLTHKAAKPCAIGTWKVYENPQTAQRLFERYRKCTRVYRDVYARHRNLSRLIVR